MGRPCWLWRRCSAVRGDAELVRLDRAPNGVLPRLGVRPGCGGPSPRRLRHRRRSRRRHSAERWRGRWTRAVGRCVATDLTKVGRPRFGAGPTGMSTASLVINPCSVGVAPRARCAPRGSPGCARPVPAVDGLGAATRHEGRLRSYRCGARGRAWSGRAVVRLPDRSPMRYCGCGRTPRKSMPHALDILGEFG